MKRVVWTRTGLSALVLALVSAAIGPAAYAQIQDPSIVMVPFAQSNAAIPHPAHEGARITLKGILRNANCAGGYRVQWDIDGDANYDEETVRVVTPTSGTVYDIGRTFNVPNVARDSRLAMTVRVLNTCTMVPAFGTFRLFVYDFTPAPNPEQWTPDQVGIMAQMAVQESMWWAHRNQVGRVSIGTNIGKSQFGSYQWANTGVGLWLFTINGHQPALPPGTINLFNQPLPDGWAERNLYRWTNDPYAETVGMMANGIINSGTGFVNISCEDEENTCGYNPDGTQRNCNRLPGTEGCRGLYTATTRNTYVQGMALGGLATLLPTFGGTRLQVGTAGIVGMTWPNFVQELSDLLGWEQVKSGCANGGWYYQETAGTSCGYSDASTSQWAYIGLESAEINGAPYGVFVNNRHKYRIAANLIANQSGEGASTYTTGRPSNFQLTGGGILAGRWLGVHTFAANDNTVAFPVHGNNHTRGQLRTSYDRYIQYTAANWTSAGLLGSIGWATRLWQNGDYLCGNRNAVYNAGRCGNTYAMYSHQKGYRTGQPELETIGGHDWFREFSVYYMRAQDRTEGDYTNFGRVIDEFCANHSVTCAYGAPFVSGSFAGLSLTPTLFKPKPVAIAVVQPTTVVEGCIGGNNGLVTASHGESFHPDVSQRIARYQWDFDDGNGLWWVTNAAPDWEIADAGATFSHRYARRGNYVATLRVVDNNRVPLTASQTVSVTVEAAANVAPAAATGGPYIAEVGSALQLEGSANDVNIGCGDTVNTSWDLNNANTFNAAVGPTGVIPWNLLRAMPIGQPIPLNIRVVDSRNLVSTAATTVTIYPTEPVAVGVALPNPAACGQVVVLDGGRSYHPNPQRSIAQYRWDVDSNGTFDGGGANPQFSYTFRRFGQFMVTLQVVDDLNRSHSSQFQVSVDQGNQPPVARVSQADYTVLEGASLTLDARSSSDANVDCGDGIARYEWDLNGNGRFDDASDVQGVNPTLDWNTVSQVLQWPADRATGLPTNAVTLRVVDSFGGAATVNFTVTIYLALPIARVVQSPNPAPINLVTGSSNPLLDGRESASPIPGMTIARYDWDADDNGTFEIANQATIELARVFNPVPRPDNLPVVFVSLRVTDRDGRTATTRHRVNYRMPPTPPTADADPTDPPEAQYHVLAGDGVTLDASASFDPDTRDFGDLITRYRWDLPNVDPGDLNPAWERQINDANGDRQEARLVLSPQDLQTLGVGGPGTYGVLLEVEDTTQLRSRDTTRLHVYARNPVAVAEANPNPAACGDRVAFDAARSDHPHPNVDIASYAWDLDGDGQFDDADTPQATRQFAQFTFGQPAVVGLQVRDSNGNVGTTSVNVDVSLGNRAPTALPGGPYFIALNDPLRLDALASLDVDSACGDRIVRYEWDLNADGSVEFSGANAGATDITWAQLVNAGINRVGQFNVRLRVVDRFGVTNDAVAQIRVVNGPRAVAAAIPNMAGCQQAVTYDASGSSTDGPAGAGFDLVSYEWDLTNDGSLDRAGVRVVHNVVGQGNVTARLVVTDESGRTSTATVVVTVNINNVAPVAHPGGPYVTGRVGGVFQPVRLDGRASFDPNAPCDRIVTYRWDTDNDQLFGAADVGGASGLVGTDVVGAFVDYRNPAWQIGVAQIVRLQACDSFGLCSPPADVEITVQAEAPPVGEILSPRAGEETCVAGGQQQITFRVADPEGEPVTVIALVGGVEVGRTQINVPANGTTVDGVVTINGDAIVDGRRELILRFDDGRGGVSSANAGGLIVFDKTPPVLNVGAQPVENVCYNLNQVPVANPVVMDNLDATPLLEVSLVSAGCLRTLVARATDACGNVTTAQRPYRVAEPAAVDIQGAAEGALVANPRMTWAVIGRADCAGNIASTLSLNGAAAAPYVMGTIINVPGQYALTLTVPNCAGVAQRIVRSFIVNGPPISVPVPAGHGQRDPQAANPPGYIVAEGSALTVDGRESRPPEAADRVGRYEWDFQNDGVYDAEGPTADYPTSVNGRFTGVLRTTDSLLAVGTQPFVVNVTDVSAIVNAGGPYRVAQGVVLQFDGSATRPGSAADLIRSYRWNFGDGSPEESGANLTRPSHTYAEHGPFNVRLTVSDEDNDATAVVVVTVTDVDPIIRSVTAPPDAFEIGAMVFQVDAVGGAPADGLTRFEWDFDLDGVPDYAGANLNRVTTTFRDEGPRTVTVRVRDKDSSSVRSLDFEVRRITMTELITVAEIRKNSVVADPGTPAQARARLAGIDDAIQDGLWGERYGYTGNTWVANDLLTMRLVRAQAAGADFGNLLWAFGRQFVREIQALRDEAANANANFNAPSALRAEELRVLVEQVFSAADFEARAGAANDGFVVRDLMADAYEAFFQFSVTLDPTAAGDGYPMPDIGDVQARVLDANRINDLLRTQLLRLHTEMLAYIAAGGPNDPGAGRVELAVAVELSRNVQRLMAMPLAILCEPGACISDQEALHNELLMMELISQLYETASTGTYVRTWQHIVMLVIRFRVEASLLRVEYQCGPYSPLSLLARQSQAIGLAYIDEGRNDEALNYYRHADRKCLMVRTYNQCLVRLDPLSNPIEPVPEECVND